MLILDFLNCWHECQNIWMERTQESAEKHRLNFLSVPCVLVSCIYSSFNLEFLQDSSETHSQPADLYLFYWVRCMRSLSVSPIHRQLMSTQKHLGLIWVKTLNRQWARWREGIWNNSQVHRKDINLSWWKRLSSLGKVERSIIKYPAGSVTFGSRYSRK